MIAQARAWLFTPRGAAVYFLTAYAIAALSLLALSGCYVGPAKICTLSFAPQNCN